MKLFSRSSLLISALSTLLGLVSPQSAQAQFLGYVSPQTVSVTLFNLSACTGAAQNVNVANLGQTAHQVTYTIAGATGGPASVVILGSNDGNQFYNLSPVGTGLGINGVIFGFGYYNIFRVSITCPVGDTVTAMYAGTSGGISRTPGQADESSARVIVTDGFPANASTAFTLPYPPFGSTAGTIFFTYSAAAVAGSTLDVQIRSHPTDNAVTVLTLPLANTTTPQVFSIPAFATSLIVLSYNPGGATAANYSLRYVYSLSGQSQVSLDPCASAAISKSSAAFNAAAAATTQIVPLAAAKTIYVCGYSWSQAVLAGTVTWTSGTGVNCATGPVVLTGDFRTIIGQPFTYSGPGTVFKTSPGFALCLTATGAGAVVNGVVTYVQQ